MFDRFSLRYLVPNAVTAFSLTLSIVAILEAAAGEFDLAAWHIVWCVLLDRADGVVARLCNAASPFGEQFDSLVDMAAFGVAPAVVFFLALKQGHFAGDEVAGLVNEGFVLVCVVAYVLAAALRLARYNLTTEELGPGWFRGLPTTIAAAQMMTLLLTSTEWELPPFVLQAMPAVLLIQAILMLSNLWLPKNGRGIPREYTRLRIWLLVLIVPAGASACALGAAMVAPVILLMLAVGYPAVGFVLGALFNRHCQSKLA